MVRQAHHERIDSSCVDTYALCVGTMQTVNRAISLNVIKYQALDLLLGNEPPEHLLENTPRCFFLIPV